MTEYERLALTLQAATVRLLAELGDLTARLPTALPADARTALREAVGLARAAVAEADQAFDVTPHYRPAAG